MVYISIPLERSDTLLQPAATQGIGSVYFSRMLLGEVYSDVVTMREIEVLA